MTIDCVALRRSCYTKECTAVPGLFHTSSKHCQIMYPSSFADAETGVARLPVCTNDSTLWTNGMHSFSLHMIFLPVSVAYFLDAWQSERLVTGRSPRDSTTDSRFGEANTNFGKPLINCTTKVECIFQQRQSNLFNKLIRGLKHVSRKLYPTS